jgi:tRNA G46 methylase TrmB
MVYLHYPTPSYKKRQKKHRVMNGDFPDALERILAPGGRLSVPSDDEDYYHHILGMLDGDGRFRVVPESNRLLDPETHDQSYYHRFWRAKGKPAFGSELAREEISAPAIGGVT